MLHLLLTSELSFGFPTATKMSVTLSLKIVERALLSPYISETKLHNYIMHQAL